MTQKTLYSECPLCLQAPVVLQNNGTYRCQACGLTLKDKSVLGLFKKGHYGVAELGQKNYALAQTGIGSVSLPPDSLKVVIGNIYSDTQLAEIAKGNINVIHPVQTVLAQIILEQLNEECYINVNGVRRAHGPRLPEESWYWPAKKAPRKNLEWQDDGNLFCTTQRLVLPSDRFTFIRLDRKIVAVQAFTNGVAVQRKREDFATYFVDCQPHEAALVAAYVMAKVPALRPPEVVEQPKPTG